MKTLLKILLALLGLLVLVGGGGYAWASAKTSKAGSRTIETHRVDFPIPFPLTESEAAALAAGQDPDSAALANAIERGRHLVESRYVCGECHGKNFGGGVMIDDPMIGHAFGLNITSGEGSAVDGYTASDWDRAVRHGVAPEGRPTLMPAVDFQLMSDEELSDIVAYIRSMPPVDNEVALPRLGPLGKVLGALGVLKFAADEIPTHTAAHAARPPEAEVSVEFGRHLAGVCSGCHGSAFAGGPIPGGDPSWPPAKNLTPHPDALGSWTYDDFKNTLTKGTRPDGTPLQLPMASIVPYANSMTETELQALWTFLRSVPPVAPTS